MADIASLVVKVSTDGVNKAQSDLDKLSKQSSKTESATASLSKSFGLLNIALSAVAVGSLIKETAQLADIYKLTEGRLSLVTKNTIELATAQQEILKISQKTRQSYADTIDLYTRVARSTQDLGKSQSDILKFTEIVNKSLVISGASAENSKASIIQLGQALGSGVLQGDELRSILENTPRLAEAIAKGMGKTVGELKTLGEQGKLTAEEVFNAIQKQGDAIDKEFGKMPKTIGQATTQMGNSILELVGTMDKLTGASGFVADKISSLSKIMDDFSSNARVASSSVFEQKTVDDITIKANQIASEIQSLQTKLKENDGALWFGLDDRTQSEYISKIKRLEQQMEQLGQTAVDVLWKTSQGTKSAVLSGEQVKKQLDDALGGYKAYYQAIGDNETVLAIKRREYAEKYKNLTAQQIDQIINSERDKNNKTEKLAEEWAKRKIEIATNISIAEQDKLAEPFIKLEAKYKEDLEHFKGVNGAKERLTAEYNSEVSRLQKDLTEKFNEEEDKKAKKSAEWQVKLLEANEKYNDEIIKMQDEMYGTDSSVEQWYNNQLEYLGKLSQEAGATSEELQTLLDKIETIKAMKLEKQTISFKVEQSFYQSFESNLADSIEGAFNGKLNLSSFFSNIGRSVLGTFSGGIANNITTGLRTGSFASGLKALGLGSTSASASAAASDGGILSDLSTLSTIKSIYGLASDGLSSTVLSGFNSIAGGFDALGMTGAGDAIGQFGYGFANPFTANTSYGAIGVGSTAGGMALGGIGGYALGSIGDKIFGAKTKAGTYGAIGGAIGSVIPAIGTIAGAAIGAAIGGMFGSTKQTDAGLSFGTTTGMGQGFDEIQSYADMKKKSWFSSKKWTNYTDLSDSEVRQIKGIFDTYDYLLAQLGDTDRIILEAGKYTGKSFQDVVAKKFIEAFTDVSQSTDDTIYQAWVKYAESVDSTVIEALSASINTFIATTRAFDVWALNRSGKGIEALAKQAQWAQEDFSNLSNMLGVTGVTVENYTQMYREAVKNSFSPETITQWQSLGTALQSATNAADTYKNSILSGLQQDLTAWIGALGSIQNAMDNLNPTFMTFAELANQTINLDNYSTLLSQLEKTRQNEIEKLTQSSNERIKQLEDEKTLFLTISEFVDELTKKIIDYSVTTSSYFFSELANAKSLILSGGTPDISSLKSSASSYLDKALGESTSKIEYLREVAKVREGIGELGSLATGGSLEGIENAIKQEEETLASKLDEINQTSLAILAGYKGTATGAISSITGQMNTVSSVNPIITQAYQNILGRNPEAEGGAYWQSQLSSGASSISTITAHIAEASVAELYNSVLGRVADESGMQYWSNLVTSGSINPTQLDDLFKEAAKAELDGSHASGLDYVPFDGYVAELHKGERVQTASEVQKDSIINELQNSLKDLKDMFIKNIAETSRMSRVITRLDDNDALLVRVVV